MAHNEQNRSLVAPNGNPDMGLAYGRPGIQR